MEYYDRNGKRVKAGMILVNDQGEEWEVCATTSGITGEEDLGFSCNDGEAYPLWQFNMKEWVIKEGDQCPQ